MAEVEGGVPLAFHWGRGRGGLQLLRRLVAREKGGACTAADREAVGMALGQLHKLLQHWWGGATTASGAASY